MGRVKAGIFRLIQAYSQPCVTLAYPKPCHIPSPGLFGAGDIFKTLWKIDPLYQNPAIEQFLLALFSTIQGFLNLVYSESWPIQNTVILTKLGKSWVILEIQKPGIIENPGILKTDLFKTRHAFRNLSKI